MLIACHSLDLQHADVRYRTSSALLIKLRNDSFPLLFCCHIKVFPRAIFLSIGIVMVVYAAVAVTVIGNLPIPQLISAKDYALAQAAQPFLGTIGFKIIAIAALFSTASGINATLYGGANVSYALARDGQLPSVFERKVWGRGTEGLFITAGLTIVFANVFDLSGIAAWQAHRCLLSW